MCDVQLLQPIQECGLILVFHQLFLLICVGTGFVAMLTGEYRECLAYRKWKFFRLSSLVAYYLVIVVLWVCAAFCFKVLQQVLLILSSRSAVFECANCFHMVRKNMWTSIG